MPECWRQNRTVSLLPWAEFSRNSFVSVWPCPAFYNALAIGNWCMVLLCPLDSVFWRVLLKEKKAQTTTKKPSLCFLLTKAPGASQEMKPAPGCCVMGVQFPQVGKRSLPKKPSPDHWSARNICILWKHCCLLNSNSCCCMGSLPWHGLTSSIGFSCKKWCLVPPQHPWKPIY